MRISPSTPPQLPASCFAGNPVSPLSVDGQGEHKASPMAQSGEVEIKASPPPHRADPQRTRVVTPRRRRSPTPVELQGTRLRTHTTPTHRGGESSVRIHQLRRERELSTQPATPSNIPSAIVIPPTPADQQPLLDHEVSAQLPRQENDASIQLAAPHSTASYIPGATSVPPAVSSNIFNAIVPPTSSDQQNLYYPQQYYPHYQGAPFLPPGYPQPPGAVIYPQQLHIPQWAQNIPFSNPPDSRTSSPLFPPGPQLQHRPDSVPVSGGGSNKAASPFLSPAPTSNSPALAPAPALPPSIGHTGPLPAAPVLTSPALEPASAPPSGHISPIATSPALKPTLASPSGHIESSSIPDIAADAASPDFHKYESQTGRDALDPDPTSTPPPGRIEPSSDAASQDVHKHETQAGRDALDPDIDSSSLENLNSPPPSVGASKPKFKVGRRSKEDQEDWEKFVEDCDSMFLEYGKKKNMPMEQVFTQYSAIKRRLNADSQWNIYQKLWAANNKQEMERARKHILDLKSEGGLVEDTEEMSTRALCSYGYAAYKQEHADDWKDRLELYNDLELVSGEPMDYRSRTKAWNKFVDKLKRLVSNLIPLHKTLLMYPHYMSVWSSI